MPTTKRLVYIWKSFLFWHPWILYTSTLYTKGMHSNAISLTMTSNHVSLQFRLQIFSKFYISLLRCITLTNNERFHAKRKMTIWIYNDFTDSNFLLFLFLISLRGMFWRTILRGCIYAKNKQQGTRKTIKDTLPDSGFVHNIRQS